MKVSVVLLSVLIAAALACSGGVLPDLNPTPQGTTAPGLAAWNLFDPRDPSAPDLFAREEDGYRLAPGWKVQSIEYVFKWWGLSPEPVFDYQRIDRGEGSFDGKGDDVQALLDSLVRLHPSQMLLAGQGHTDDYPSWALELLGVDGQRVLIMSSSTDNPGSGPWNVYYNGRLYAQYDGTLGGRIGALFDHPGGEPAAAYYPGGHEPGTSSFGTQGWPAQLSSGFSGLLPIADDLRYHADAVTGEIVGTLHGRSSIGGFGNMVIGRVTALAKIELAAGEGKTVACAIKDLPTDDPVGAGWKFTCPLGTAPVTGRFAYSITVEFGTDKGETLTTTGQLHGTWGEAIPVVPLPEELQAAFAQDAGAQDLLADHVPVYALYSATVDAEKAPYKGKVAGEVVLVGQTAIDGRPVRYTIGTPFGLEDGKLVRWALTRQALQSLVTDVSGLPLTRRVLAAKADAIVNLWYAETGPELEVGAYIGNYQSEYALTLAPCGDLPGTGRYPSQERPLRAFGYDSSWELWMADFALVDGQAVVADLDLWPARGAREELLPVLMPQAFDTGASRPFERVWLSRTPSFSKSSTQLTLWVPEDATEAERGVYDRLAAALPVSVDKEYETLWQGYGLTFAVTQDGSLEVVECK